VFSFISGSEAEHQQQRKEKKNNPNISKQWKKVGKVRSSTKKSGERKKKKEHDNKYR